LDWTTAFFPNWHVGETIVVAEDETLDCLDPLWSIHQQIDAWRWTVNDAGCTLCYLSDPST